MDSDLIHLTFRTTQLPHPPSLCTLLTRVYYCFLVFRRIDEYISLDLFRLTLAVENVTCQLQSDLATAAESVSYPCS